MPSMAATRRSDHIRIAEISGRKTKGSVHDMYARKNTLKEKVARGEMVTGLEIWLRDPRVIELMGHAGFDFVHIENEHVAQNWEQLENLVRTAELAGLTTVYRTEQCVEGRAPINEIIKALKCGAQIIKVPHVDTPEMAQEIVQASLLPPQGFRGIATCDRSALEIPPKGTLDIVQYVRDVNAQVGIWVIVETPLGLKNVEAIMAIDGVDAVGFGHQDYAIAAGLDSDSGPEIEAARARVMAAALAAGKQMWCNTVDPEQIRALRAKGLCIFRLAVDVVEMNAQFRTWVQTAKGAA
jgi:4-hydroxy-2-oxoheptanedioate aldolase